MNVYLVMVHQADKDKSYHISAESPKRAVTVLIRDVHEALDADGNAKVSVTDRFCGCRYFQVVNGQYALETMPA